MTWYLLIPSLYPTQQEGLVPVGILLGIIGVPVTICVSVRQYLIASEKNIQRMLHVVTDQVNASLQRDDETTTAHLMLTIHDVENVENRRYQLEERRRSVVDPIIMGQDIP